MQAAVARFLLFTAQQQARSEEAGAGLTAQLHALQLACALQAEAGQLPPSSSQLLSVLQTDCARLLATAGASQPATEARCASFKGAACTRRPQPYMCFGAYPAVCG